MNCLVVKKIKKIIKGYLKNITDNTCEYFDTPAIINKNKLNYIFENTKYTIYVKEKEIILIRENNEIKNILTFSKNRSILSEYIIKENNLSVYIEIETIDYIIEEKLIYIKYKVTDSNCIYEYKINIGG